MLPQAHFASRVLAAPLLPLLLTAACGGSGLPGTDAEDRDRGAAAAERLEPAALPDLARVSDSVREQVQARWRPVERLQGGGAAPAASAAETYGALGMVLMAAEFPNAAIPAFRNAQALAPGDVRWPYYLAHLHREAGALDEAADRFETARRLQPGDMAILVWLGDVRLAQGDAEAAEPLFAQALSLYPDSLSARFGLARTALMRGEFEAAAEGLEEILALEPSATAAHYPLGQAYLSLGESERAQEHLRQREAADIRPADPLMAALDRLLESAQAYETRGIEALNREDWDGAVAAFRRGLEIDPDDAELRHRLGTALYLRGDVPGRRARNWSRPRRRRPSCRRRTTAWACCCRTRAGTGRRPSGSPRRCGPGPRTWRHASGWPSACDGRGIPRVRWRSTGACRARTRTWSRRLSERRWRWSSCTAGAMPGPGWSRRRRPIPAISG